MAAIDWKLAFDSEIENKWDAENNASWENEQKIESVVEELKLLESIDEGKVVAAGLKHTFWTGISYQELVGNISPLKNKIIDEESSEGSEYSTHHTISPDYKGEIQVSLQNY